jgi:hypothetical protein
MANSGETLTNAAGLVKQVYDDEVNKKVIPVSGILQKEVDFVPQDQHEGAQWNQPVLLQLPSGFTYGQGLANYQAIVPSQVQYAFLTGSNINLQDGVANDLIARTISNKNSFMTAAKYTLMALEKGMKRQLETDILYGQKGLGQTSVIANTSSTTSTITIVAAEWASAIWSGFEGCLINFYNAGSLVGTNGYTLTSVNIPNQTLLVTGTTGDTTTLQALNGTLLDLYISNSFGNQMLGIHGITASFPGTPATLFGLSTTAFSVWSGNQFPVGGVAISLGKIEDGVGLAAARGAEDEDISTLINPVNYTNCVVEASSARRYDSSYKQGKLDNGARALEYYGPTGLIQLVSHPFVKQGYAYGLPLERCKRIGSVDVTFDLPGFAGPALYVPSSTFTGVLVTEFTSQAFYLEAPSHSIQWTGIVPSTN